MPQFDHCAYPALSDNMTGYELGVTTCYDCRHQDYNCGYKGRWFRDKDAKSL
jgi:hypothetical protein